MRSSQGLPGVHPVSTPVECTYVYVHFLTCLLFCSESELLDKFVHSSYGSTLSMVFVVIRGCVDSRVDTINVMLVFSVMCV